MVSTATIFNYIGFAAVIIGFFVTLAGIIYIAATNDIDAWFWSLVSIGLALIFIGLVIGIIAYIIERINFNKVNKTLDQYRSKFKEIYNQKFNTKTIDSQSLKPTSENVAIATEAAGGTLYKIGSPEALEAAGYKIKTVKLPAKNY